MQLDIAERLRERWGDKPCDHPTVAKEYCLGAQTGDYVCTQCGEARPGFDWNRKPEQDNKA